mgnify:CR=1 FL=1
MKDKDKNSAAGLAIPAGLFVGMGIGFLTGSIGGWLFIGLGAGFVVMAILKSAMK